MLAKKYGEVPQSSERKYRQLDFVSAGRKKINGNPDKAHISISYVERQKLTMRMGMRNFTRLTNAFSKIVEIHAHAVTLYLMHYNFGGFYPVNEERPKKALDGLTPCAYAKQLEENPLQ